MREAIKDAKLNDHRFRAIIVKDGEIIAKSGKRLNVALFNMKVYVTYKFEEEEPNELKTRLEAFSKLIEESTGWKTFIFFRDVQKWKVGTMTMKQVVNRAMEEIQKCDAVLVEASEKARGVYFEAGYAKALGKKIIVIHQKNAESNFLDASADVKIEYETDEDLKLKEIK